MSLINGIVIGIITGGILMLLVLLGLRRFSVGPGVRQLTFHSSIEQMRAIGQLSVFKVITKEIVTEVDHTWGETGKKYLSWLLSNKKMAMIFEFEIDFRYDLRSSQFEIVGSNGNYILKMPPCFYETHIRDIQFYDEQKSRLLPWLLPDLINPIFGNGFSEEDKNHLKNEAKKRAEEQAKKLINSLTSEVEQSAKQTLQSLAKAFGAENVGFDFRRSKEPALTVDFKEK